MITRPLDLAARLRPQPRSLNVVFLVNGALIALFFTLFGSRFVLSPGLGVDFKLPVSSESVAGAAPTDVVISVKRRDMAFGEGAGPFDFRQLREWLTRRAEGKKGLRLLVQVNSEMVTTEDLTTISDMARDAGFESPVRVAAELPPPK